MNPSLGKESQIQTEISDPNQWGCPETTWCTHGLKTLDQDARYSGFCFDSTVKFAGRTPTASVKQCLCRVFGNTQFGLSCFYQLGQRNRLFPSDLPAGYCTAMTWIMAVPPSLAQEICQQEESAKEVIAALWLYSHSYWQGLWRGSLFLSAYQRCKPCCPCCPSISDTSLVLRASLHCPSLSLVDKYWDSPGHAAYLMTSSKQNNSNTNNKLNLGKHCRK